MTETAVPGVDTMPGPQKGIRRRHDTRPTPILVGPIFVVIGLVALWFAVPALLRRGLVPLDEYAGGMLFLVAIGGLFTLAGSAVFVSSLRARRRPRSAGPAIQVLVTDPPEGPMAASFERLAATALDGMSVEGGGAAAMLVGAAIEAVADVARNRPDQPEILAVGPDGLRIPGVGLLAWDQVAEVRVDEGLLTVLPRDPTLIARRVPDEAPVWTVKAGFWTSSGEQLPSTFALRLDMVKAAQDDVVNSIARNFLIDLGQ